MTITTATLRLSTILHCSNPTASLCKPASHFNSAIVNYTTTQYNAAIHFNLTIITISTAPPTLNHHSSRSITTYPHNRFSLMPTTAESERHTTSDTDDVVVKSEKATPKRRSSKTEQSPYQSPMKRLMQMSKVPRQTIKRIKCTNVTCTPTHVLTVLD